MTETREIEDRLHALLEKGLEAVRARNADLALLYMREAEATARMLPRDELRTLEDVKQEIKDGW